MLSTSLSLIDFLHDLEDILIDLHSYSSELSTLRKARIYIFKSLDDIVVDSFEIFQSLISSIPPLINSKPAGKSIESMVHKLRFNLSKIQLLLKKLKRYHKLFSSAGIFQIIDHDEVILESRIFSKKIFVFTNKNLLIIDQENEDIKKIALDNINRIDFSKIFSRGKCTIDSKDVKIKLGLSIDETYLLKKLINRSKKMRSLKFDHQKFDSIYHFNHFQQLKLQVLKKLNVLTFL